DGLHRLPQPHVARTPCADGFGRPPGGIDRSRHTVSDTAGEHRATCHRVAWHESSGRHATRQHSGRLSRRDAPGRVQPPSRPVGWTDGAPDRGGAAAISLWMTTSEFTARARRALRKPPGYLAARGVDAIRRRLQRPLSATMPSLVTERLLLRQSG